MANNTPALPSRTGENEALIDTIKALHKVEVIDGSLNGDGEPFVPVAAVPHGLQLQSLKPFADEYRMHPERRAGTARLGDLPSFIAHTLRFKDADSAIFATRDAERPALTTVFDYHPQGPDPLLARFGGHRGHYTFPLSEQWRAWAAVDGKPKTQGDFARFIEDRIMDIQPMPTDGGSGAGALTLDLISMLGGKVAGPTQMLETARGLRMHERSQVTNAVNTATGEVDLVFKTEHVNQQGQPLQVPTLFVIGIPVFEGDAAYRLPVRLTYRRDEGAIFWTIRRYRPEIVFFDAFDRALEKVRTETALPVFIGSPEA